MQNKVYIHVIYLHCFYIDISRRCLLITHRTFSHSSWLPMSNYRWTKQQTQATCCLLFECEHTFRLRNHNNMSSYAAEVSSVQVNLFVFLPGARNTICPHQQQKHNNWCALSPTRSEATKPFKYGVLFNRVAIGGVLILRKYLA